MFMTFVLISLCNWLDFYKIYVYCLFNSWQLNHSIVVFLWLQQIAFLRGTVLVLEIVFVGPCEVFICLDFVLTFFPLAAKLIGPRMGRQFFKNVDFSATYPLKSVTSSMSYSRGMVSVLEIVFVGQCEVFVCLDFALTFFPLAVKLIGPRMGRQFFKNVNFSVTYPLKLQYANLYWLVSY